jgi:glutamine cyclotransferase
MHRNLRIGYWLIPVLVASCSGGADKKTEPPAPAPAPTGIQNLSYQVMNTIPHDSASFIEGYELHDSVLYESEGNYGSSALAAYSLKDGKRLSKKGLDKTYFAEGITQLGGNLYQLTYKEHTIFVYHFPDLTLMKAADWDHEGWGMTNDGKYLISDDGSDKIYFTDPQTLKDVKTISVTDDQGPLDQINELEYVDGQLFANRWHTDSIYRIDPGTGKVTGILNLQGIFGQVGMNYVPGDPEDVLNGIAYDKVNKEFIVTGKRWPRAFVLKLN